MNTVPLSPTMYSVPCTAILDDLELEGMVTHTLDTVVNARPIMSDACGYSVRSLASMAGVRVPHIPMSTFPNSSANTTALIRITSINTASFMTILCKHNYLCVSAQIEA